MPTRLNDDVLEANGFEADIDNNGDMKYFGKGLRLLPIGNPRNPEYETQHGDSVSTLEELEELLKEYEQEKQNSHASH